MIESNLLPDFVLSIEDDQAPQNFLLARYAKMKGLPDPSTFKALEKPSEEQPVSITLKCVDTMRKTLCRWIRNDVFLNDRCQLLLRHQFLYRLSLLSGSSKGRTMINCGDSSQLQ